MDMSIYRLSRRQFLKTAGAVAASGLLVNRDISAVSMPKRPHVLMITADDMNWDSPGCFGSKTPDITPHIDRLAEKGLRFQHAHITIAVCQPCRSVWMTGRYPHRNGAEGFQPIDVKVPTLQESLHEAGYLNGILGKVGHLAPREKFKWDMTHDVGELGHGRDPAKYYQYAKGFFQQVQAAGKSFFLMANSHDPHRPFHGSQQERQRFGKRLDNITKPSRVYQPQEIEVPKFLPDIPEVRKEIAQYYSSVRRCDDTVGAVMRALNESGLAENTLVMFLSDHGMPLPFAKTNCYLHSTKIPWIVCWPGKVKADAVDKEHFISGIDFMPTILDAAGVRPPGGLDGSSFLPLLFGKKQSERDKVFTQFHQTSARRRFPMRCVQNHRFGYLFNPWADGKRIFRNESQSGLTFKAMQAAAQDNAEIAARVKLFQYRVLEEFYDLQNDPDALTNLIDDPKYRKEINTLRSELLAWMEHTGDPAWNALQNLRSTEARQKFMAEQDAKAQAGRKTGKNRKSTRPKKRGN
jgi:N-sulfoglucosamine sulfohydrolase